MLLIFISFLLFRPNPLKKKMSIVIICVPNIYLIFTSSLAKWLLLTKVYLGLWQPPWKPPAGDGRGVLNPSSSPGSGSPQPQRGKGPCLLPWLPDTSTWPPQSALAFFSFSNHMTSTRLTSLAEKFLPLRKVYLVQVTSSRNSSFSIATWIRPNHISDLSQTLTASYPPKAKWCQDRKVKCCPGNIWACFHPHSLVWPR